MASYGKGWHFWSLNAMEMMKAALDRSERVDIDIIQNIVNRSYTRRGMAISVNFMQIP